MFSKPNVGVHLRRTLCDVRVERIVRIFILAARLFHSQLQIVFSSAESGRISGQADLHIFRSERQRSPSAHLVRRKGGTPCWLHFSWLLLAPAQNRFRVVRALRVFSGGRSVVRALTIIFLANVTVQGTRHLVEGTLEPIVRNSILQ